MTRLQAPTCMGGWNMGLAGTRPAGPPRPIRHAHYSFLGDKRRYFSELLHFQGVALACALYPEAVPALCWKDAMTAWAAHRTQLAVGAGCRCEAAEEVCEPCSIVPVRVLAEVAWRVPARACTPERPSLVATNTAQSWAQNS